MTPQERLKLYETALIDWKARKEMPFWERAMKHLQSGFCYYFKNAHYVNLYIGDEYFKQTLPELFSQKPLSDYAAWFYYEDTQSRIICLENAIKLIKETYNL